MVSPEWINNYFCVIFLLNAPLTQVALGARTSTWNEKEYFGYTIPFTEVSQKAPSLGAKGPTLQWSWDLVR